MALADSDDFVETAHIVEHFVIKLCGFAANIPTETAYRRAESFGSTMPTVRCAMTSVTAVAGLNVSNATV